MRLTNILMATRKLPSSYHNLPDRFIKRKTMFLIKRTPNLPQYEQKIYRYKKEPYYDQWRVWEFEGEQLNAQGAKSPKIFVEPIREWSFFRGDRVEVIRGPEKGKQGIINHIVKERNWVFVQGLNLRRKISRPDDTSLGIVTAVEEPFLINEEVKLVDPSDLLPTETEWRYDDDGNRLRVSTRTERVIPMPNAAFETMDYVDKKAYREAAKDTPAKLVNQITFFPASKTFEMDICEEHGIKEDRIPYPMYWY